MNKTQLIIALLLLAALAFLAWFFLAKPKSSGTATTGATTTPEMKSRASGEFYSGTGRCYCGDSSTGIPANGQADCDSKCGGQSATFVPYRTYQTSRR